MEVDSMVADEGLQNCLCIDGTIIEVKYIVLKIWINKAREVLTIIQTEEIC